MDQKRFAELQEKALIYARGEKYRDQNYNYESQLPDKITEISTMISAPEKDFGNFGLNGFTAPTMFKEYETDSFGIDVNEIKKTNAYKHMFYSSADVLEEARKINKATGIPESAMLTSPEHMDKAREIYAEKEKQLDINKVYKKYPGLEALATMDETAAAIALHDLEDVSKTHGIIEAAQIGWHTDELHYERNQLGSKKFKKGLTNEEEQRIKDIENEMKNMKQIPELLDAPLEAIVGGVSQQAPMMIRSILKGQLTGLAGAVLGGSVGAAAGSLGGAAGIAVGASQGARYGYSLGARAGYGAAMFDEVVGGYYLDYINYKDKAGNQLLTDEQAMNYASIAALVESGIELANTGKIINILKGNKKTVEAGKQLEKIIQGAQDTASMQARLKYWLKDNAKDIGVVTFTESAEEAAQEASNMIINNLAAYNNPQGDIPVYSAGDIAERMGETFYQSLPAAIGFGGLAVGGRSIGLVRDLAALNQMEKTEIFGRLKNISGLQMIEKLAADKQSNKLAIEHPETYNKLLKNTLDGSQFKQVYIDTLSLSEDKEGAKILNQLISEANLDADKAETIKETKSDLVMHTADYLKVVINNEELRQKLNDYISFDAAVNSFARNKTLAEQLKKDMDNILSGESERTLINISNIVNEIFEEQDERDLAEFLIHQYEDPNNAADVFIAEKNSELNEMYAPIIETMRKGMKQGVAKYRDEETGRWLRASNNDAWYMNYFAENKKAPSQKELKNLAREILLGNNKYGVEEYNYTIEGADEWIESNKATIESIESQIELAEKIKKRMKLIKKEDLALTEGLSESGIKVYKAVSKVFAKAKNKDLQKSGNMNALLFAYRAERFAEAMRKSGKKDFTAEDYLARFKFKVNADMGSGLNQVNIINKDNFYTTELTGNEFGNYKDLKELRTKAVAWYRDNLQGTTVENEYLGKIRIGKGMTQNDLAFSSIGRKKMSHTSAKEEKLLSVMYLRELIENANFITESDGDKEKHEGEHFYYLHTKLKDAQNNELYLVVNVKEDMYGRLMYYNHNIFNADEYKKIEDAYTENPEPRISSPGVDNQKAPSFTNSITGKGRVYKQQGIVFNQTAYHGTPHSFDKFDLGAIGTGEGAQAHGWGLYFAENKKTAESYRDTLIKTRGLDRELFIDGKKISELDTLEQHAAYIYQQQFGLRLKSEYASDINLLLDIFTKQINSDKKIRDVFQKEIDKIENNSKISISQWQKEVPADHEWRFKSILNSAKAKAKVQGKRTNIAIVLDTVKEHQQVFIDRISKTQYDVSSLEKIKNKNIEVRETRGSLFEVDIPDKNVLLDEQKTLNEQPKKVRDILTEIAEKQVVQEGGYYNQFATAVLKEDPSTIKGRNIYKYLSNVLGTEKDASVFLNKNGIKGISYLGLRDGRCFVVFDDAAIGVINRFNQAAGINAKTANFDRLEEAKKLEKNNAGREEIYYKTGWYKGPDGKWRFDIPDFLPSYSISKFEVPAENETMLQGTLAEIYPNQNLFKAYPELRDIKVYVVNKDESYYGYAGSKYIVLNAKSLGSFKNLDSREEASKTLIHEIQHIIQNYEGFAKGGSEKYVRRLINNQIKALKAEVDNYNDAVQKWWKLEQKAEESFFSDVSEEAAEQLQNKADAFAEENNISTEKQNDYRELAYRIERLENALKEKDDFKLYHNLYGEVEARSASSKADLNDKIRKAKDDAVKYRYEAQDAYIDLPEELQKIADEYKSVNESIQKLTDNQNEESYYEKSYELAEQLNVNEAGMKYVSATDNMFWSLGTVQELENEYVSELISGSADALKNIYVYENDLKNYSYSPKSNYVKGQAQINSNGSRVIYLYKHADQSTFLHEMAHVFLEDTKELAAISGAPAQIKKDYETIVKWAEWQEGQVEEYKDTAIYSEFMMRDSLIRTAIKQGFAERKNDDGSIEQITLEELLYEWQQERFARGFEAYVGSGKAPTDSLRGVFYRFSQWLKKIYKSIKRMGIQPSEDVKAVMDRMVASQDEIDLAVKKAELIEFEKAGGFKYLTENTETMWLKIIDEIKEEAMSRILKVAMQDIKDVAKEERKQKIAAEREEAYERISQEPVFVIQKYLKNNPGINISVAAQTIGNMTAEEYVRQLKEKGGTLEKAVDAYMAEYEKELDRNVENEKQLREKAEQAVMSNKYKKLLTAYEYAAIERAIDRDKKFNKATRKEDKDTKNTKAIINLRSRVNKFVNKYTEQMKKTRENVINLKKAQRGLRDVANGNVALIDNYAKNKIETLPLSDAIVPAVWYKKSRQASNLVNVSIVKDEWENAVKYKKHQLVYDSIGDLAVKNRELVRKSINKLKDRHNSILKNKNMGAQDRYIFNHLLYVFGIIPKDAPKPSGDINIADLLVGYDNNLELQFVNEDGGIDIPDWFLNAATGTEAREKGFTDLTIPQFKDFMKIMDNLYTVAINAKKLRAITDENGNKMLLENVVSDITTEIAVNNESKENKDVNNAGNISNRDKVLRVANEIHVSLLRPEFVLEQMGDMATKYIFNPLSKASDKELEMATELSNDLAAIMKAYESSLALKYTNEGKTEKEAEKLAKKTMEEFKSKALYKLGTSMLTKENVISIALNWGTEINRKRVMDGFKVSSFEVEELLRTLDGADWMLVTNLWGVFDNYWQDIVDMEARISGVVLEKQEGIDFTILSDDGMVYPIKGSYYPIKYDPAKNTRVEENEADESRKISMSGMARLGIGLGTLKERSGKNIGYALRNDLGVISEVLSDNIHMLAMREAVRDVNKIINDYTFKETIEAYYGKATYKMLQNWVLDCWAREPKVKSWYEKGAAHLRKKQTEAVLGFRATTALLNVCNIGPMMDYIGAAETIKVLKDFYSEPNKKYNFIMGKSVVLRNRALTMDRDMADILRGMDKKENALNSVRNSAFWFITKTDLMLACPLWLHEYQKTYQNLMEKNLAPDKIETLAVAAGDKAVRKVFGSNRTVDMAAIQRGSELDKLFTMYYSYFSILHNTLVSKAFKFKKDRKENGLKAYTELAKGLIYWLIIPAAIEAVMKAMISGDDEPEDVAKKTAITTVSSFVGGIPVLRDIVPEILKIALNERHYASNIPVYEYAEQNLKVIQTLNNDEKDIYDFVRELLKTIDMTIGAPIVATDAAVTAAEWLDYGELTSDSILHYLWAALFGKKPDKN